MPHLVLDSKPLTLNPEFALPTGFLGIRQGLQAHGCKKP